MMTETKNRTGNRSILGRFKSNFIYMALSEVVGKVLFFITNIYIARCLSVEKFGVFTFAQTVIFYLWLGVGLGTNMYGIREIARDKNAAGKIINPLFSMRVTSALIIFSVYCVSLWFIEMESAHRLVFIGCGLYLPAYALYSDWVLKGLEKFKYLAFGTLVYSFSYFFLITCLVKDDTGLIWASFSWSLSYFLGSFSLLCFISGKIGIQIQFQFDLSLWISHLKKSVYFMTSGFLRSGYNYLPVLLLKLFHTNEHIAIFGAAYKIVITLCHAGALVMISIYPIISEVYKKNKKQFFDVQKKMMQLMLTGGLLAGAAGIIFGTQIITLLLTEKYTESIIVFKIMMFFLAASLVRNALGQGLQAAGLQKLHTFSSFIGLTVSGLLGFQLIYKYGSSGAALTLVFSEILVVGSMGCFLRVEKQAFAVSRKEW